MVGFLYILEPNPPIDDVIRAGIVPKLVEFLQNGANSMLQVKYAMFLSSQ